jgi:hypothetical protein
VFLPASEESITRSTRAASRLAALSSTTISTMNSRVAGDSVHPLRRSPSLGLFGNTGNDVLKVKNRTRQLGVSLHPFADEGSTGHGRCRKCAVRRRLLSDPGRTWSQCISTSPIWLTAAYRKVINRDKLFYSELSHPQGLPRLPDDNETTKGTREKCDRSCSAAYPGTTVHSRTAGLAGHRQISPRNDDPRRNGKLNTVTQRAQPPAREANPPEQTAPAD